MTKMAHVERGSDEWAGMWAALASCFDIDAVDEETGESWQYMGSHDEGAGWKHGFRHRSLHGQRIYRNVSASVDWVPETFIEHDFEALPF